MNFNEARAALGEIAMTAECHLDLAEACVADGDFEGALKATHTAAWLLRTQNRDLSSARVEAIFQRIARELPDFDPGNRGRAAGKTVLHVITDALGHGGHTAMAMRWMQEDQGRRHCVALLNQTGAVPEHLSRSVLESGGEVHIASTEDSFFNRAGWLRQLAIESAGYVVLHIDMDDVIAPTAFGRAGGPPVLFVNHAAHVYWTGASVTDLVVNSRGSELEIQWTVQYRGIPRCATIPMPLVAPAQTDCGAVAEVKARAREAVGIAKDEILVLTSGDTYKYAAACGIDFLATCEEILRECPAIRVIAVGPKEDERWQQARERTSSRIKTVGRQPREQVSVFQQAADIYVEGFPFGSTTALLEAGLRGVPAVLAPVQCPPPYATDGVAVDEVVERAQSVEAYKRRIIQLANDPQLRSRLGCALEEVIRRHHTGTNWKRYIEEAVRQLPKEHSIYPPVTPDQTPESDHLYWTEFHRQSPLSLARPVEDSAAYGFSIGFRPKFGSSLVRSDEAGPLRARFLTAIADRYCVVGQLGPAREFYSGALRCDSRLAKVRAKRFVLSFGKSGQHAWDSITSLGRRLFSPGTMKTA